MQRAGLDKALEDLIDVVGWQGMRSSGGAPLSAHKNTQRVSGSRRNPLTSSTPTCPQGEQPALPSVPLPTPPACLPARPPAFPPACLQTYIDAPNAASGPIPDDVSPFFEGPYFEW
jgi:hypothetical protein